MEEKTLVKKLAKVMQEVKYIQKTGFNTFHKYKYATEADVNEKVREELAKQNVIMLPSMLGHEMRTHTNRSGATEYITCVDMQFTFVDGDSGESFTVNMSGEGQDAGDKGIYKAIAGAQKYALMKVFMIPTGDDPEADEGVDERNQGKVNTPQKTQGATDLATDAQVKKMFAMVRGKGIPDSEIKTKIADLGKTSSKELTKADINKVFDWIEKYKVEVSA